ncbi:hypothetical protein ABZP36_021643 [Zizania latifolia]
MTGASENQTGRGRWPATTRALGEVEGDSRSHSAAENPQNQAETATPPPPLSPPRPVTLPASPSPSPSPTSPAASDDAEAFLPFLPDLLAPTRPPLPASPPSPTAQIRPPLLLPLGTRDPPPPSPPPYPWVVISRSKGAPACSILLDCHSTLAASLYGSFHGINFTIVFANITPWTKGCFKLGLHNKELYWSSHSSINLAMLPVILGCSYKAFFLLPSASVCYGNCKCVVIT